MASRGRRRAGGVEIRVADPVGVDPDPDPTLEETPVLISRLYSRKISLSVFFPNESQYYVIELLIRILIRPILPDPDPQLWLKSLKEEEEDQKQGDSKLLREVSTVQWLVSYFCSRIFFAFWDTFDLYLMLIDDVS